MTIISKYKDFYDYLTGIYGVDPLVVYERFASQASGENEPVRPGPVVSLQSLTKYGGNKFFRFYILGIKLPVVFFNEKLYVTPEELVMLYESKAFKAHPIEGLWSDLHYVYGYQKKQQESKYFWPQAPIDYNDKFKCPIVLLDSGMFYLNPKLKEFRIGELISPKEMYLNLTDYFSKKDLDMPKDPKDMNRYEAKGFDKKTSFRNIK